MGAPPEGCPIGEGREDPNQDPSTRSGRQVHLSVMLARVAGPLGAPSPGADRRRASAVGVSWPQDANIGRDGPGSVPARTMESAESPGAARTPREEIPPPR